MVVLSKPAYLQELRSNTSPYDVQLDKAEFWVQLHKIPHDIANLKMAKIIGNRLWSFVKANFSNYDGTWNAFIRLRIRMEVNKPLRRGVKIKQPNGHAEKYFPHQLAIDEDNFVKLYGPELRAARRAMMATSEEARDVCVQRSEIVNTHVVSLNDTCDNNNSNLPPHSSYMDFFRNDQNRERKAQDLSGSSECHQQVEEPMIVEEGGSIVSGYGFLKGSCFDQKATVSSRGHALIKRLRFSSRGRLRFQV
nr:uncharacterized protein LOC109147843 [Ipomoea batatas]